MNNKFQTLKSRLDRAKQEINEAIKIAPAKCCGNDLSNLLENIQKSIDTTQDHIDNGIDEGELK